MQTSPWRDPWIWAGAALIGAALVAGVWVVLALTRTQAAPEPVAAVVTVIPAPTATPTVVLSPTPEGGTPTPIAPPPPAAGSIVAGATVQVRGTGGDGLRLRTEPSLSAPIVALANEGEVFRVMEGPHSADGYTWWRLVSPNDAQRTGWAVDNYLSVLPTPLAPTATPGG